MNSELNPLAYHHILKKTFSFLPYDSLCQASQVSRFWNEVGSLVLQQRRQEMQAATIFIRHPYQAADTRRLATICNTIKSKDLSQELKTWIEDPDTQPHYKDISQAELENVTQNIQQALKDSYYEPNYVLYFGSHLFKLHVVPKGHRRMGLRTTFHSSADLSGDEDDADAILGQSEGISTSVGHVTLLGHGLIFCKPEGSFGGEGPCAFEIQCNSEQYDIPMIAGMILPKLNGIKITPFPTKATIKYNAYDHEVTSENCKKFLSIQPEDDVKGIIFFQEYDTDNINNLRYAAIDEYMSKHPKTVFAGGVFIKRVFSSLFDDRSLSSGGLIISGDDRVRLGTTAFLKNERMDQNQHKLKQFMDHGLCAPGRTTFAFMFASQLRGNRLYGDVEHMEPSIFHSMFPRTPLIGGFTVREHFHPYIHGQEQAPAWGWRSSSPLLGSTVVLFVSIGI